MKKKNDIEFTITNMVASGNLGFELDLYMLPQQFEGNVEYEPEQFPGAIVKFNKPKATLLVFKNGEVVVVGCKDRKMISKALEKAHKLLKPLAQKVNKKVNPKNVPFKITNMVAASDLHFSLDLFRIATEVEADIEYEPEQFPGAILKLKKPPVSLLVFKNGKTIIAGARKREEIIEAIRNVKKLLKPFAE